MRSILTLRTSCNEDILPRGLGERGGNDGGCSRGLIGGLFVPITLI